MADIIDYLSKEDLAEYRRLTAIEGVLMGGRSDVPLDDAAQMVVECWQFLADIQKRYEIDADDAFDVRVYDGALVRVE